MAVARLPRVLHWGFWMVLEHWCSSCKFQGDSRLPVHVPPIASLATGHLVISEEQWFCKPPSFPSSFRLSLCPCVHIRWRGHRAPLG